MRIIEVITVEGQRLSSESGKMEEGPVPVFTFLT